VTTGTFSGRFDPVRLLKALQDYKITNMSAAATHYRMMKNSEKAKIHLLHQEVVLHREPIDPATLEFIDGTFHVPACSMYGTTEIGCVLVNYPACARLCGQAGLVGTARPRPETRMQILMISGEAGRHRRTHALAPRPVGNHQGSRAHR